MGSALAVVPSASLRREVFSRGGASVARCYQCATCSGVCMLATVSHVFPRQQMLWTQWGLADKLASDPAIWLCHQCNDCSERCPRDAKPGDVMQVSRAMAVEVFAFPRFVGRLVGKAALTWPLLLGLPLLFWVGIILALNGGTIPMPIAIHWAYGDVVPHWLIYAVFFPTSGAVAVAALVGATRAWKRWGESVTRSGSFVGSLVSAAIDIMTHKRFASCDTSASRRWPHFLLFWGFVGAAAASGFIVIWMYVPGLEISFPIPLDNWMKIIGNVSAVALVIGGLWLLVNRLRGGNPTGASLAFDNLFLSVVLLVIATGVLAELGRIYFVPAVAVGIYFVHLSAVMSLFLAVPYSKFAHLVYRTLAMVHERMVAPAAPGPK